jgi:hypothetical protein
MRHRHGREFDIVKVFYEPLKRREYAVQGLRTGLLRQCESTSPSDALPFAGAFKDRVDEPRRTPPKSCMPSATARESSAPAAGYSRGSV